MNRRADEVWQKMVEELNNLVLSKEELRDWIARGWDDIEFLYKGKHGVICSYSDMVALCFNGEGVEVASADAAMKEPFIEGKTLEEVCQDLEYLILPTT